MGDDGSGSPVVITCVAPGEYKAFHNVCPHRASLLCNDPGIHSQKHLVCPYHAWVYDLQGTLVGAPSQAKFSASFKPENYDLKPVRLETWCDFLLMPLHLKTSPSPKVSKRVMPAAPINLDLSTSSKPELCTSNG